MTLNFTNDLELLKSEIARDFPREVDGFQRLLDQLVEYDDLNQEQFTISARAMLAESIRDPLLIEMLLCPLMWYGNGAERDMLWGAFCIMFRSCFLEGFARPFDGIRPLLKVLVKKFRTCGGELKLRAGVSEILNDGHRTTGVRLDDVDGVRYDEMPVDQSAFHHAVPIYEHLDGWWEDISGARTFEDLPVNAQRYVEHLERISGTRISAIGVGPQREATIARHDLLG